MKSFPSPLAFLSSTRRIKHHQPPYTRHDSPLSPPLSPQNHKLPRLPPTSSTVINPSLPTHVSHLCPPSTIPSSIPPPHVSLRCGAVADKQQGGSSGVVIAVVVCVLLLLLLVALIYFLNKKSKLPCGKKDKKEVASGEVNNDIVVEMKTDKANEEAGLLNKRPSTEQ